MNEKPEQEATEEKIKLKPDDKSKPKSKQDEIPTEKSKDSQQNGNNESGNCYW